MAIRKAITCCPHCKSTEGIYTKSDYIGVPYYIGFGREEQFNGEMFDNCESIKRGRIAYCQNCDTPICRMSTLEKQWEEAENAT